MVQQFNVVFTGQFKPGYERWEVIRAFAERFNLDPERAATMLRADTVSILKKATDEDSAARMHSILDELGLVVEIRPYITADQLTLVEHGEALEPPADTESSLSDAPQAATESAAVPAQQLFNPYAKAAPKRQQSADDAVPLTQRVFEGSVTVSAGRGISWITEGYGKHVSKNFGPWIGAGLIYFLLTIVLSLVPIIGSLAVLLMGPVVLAGFMIGANDQAEGGDFTVGHLFSAVDQHLGQLLLVALLYLVGSILVVLLGVAMFGLSMFSMMGSEAGAMPDMMSMLLAALVMMLLLLPLMMAYWFAPALVALEGLSAFDAMKHSFIGCLKNLLPMLLYGLLALVLCLVAAIPLMLGFILLAPVLMASMYVAYKDIFRVEVTRFVP